MKKLGILALIGTGLMGGSLALADQFTSNAGDPALPLSGQKVIELGQLDTGVPPGFESGDRDAGDRPHQRNYGVYNQRLAQDQNSSENQGNIKGNNRGAAQPQGNQGQGNSGNSNHSTAQPRSNPQNQGNSQGRISQGGKGQHSD